MPKINREEYESEETEVKTLESIREEIWEEMLRIEDKRLDRWADIKYQTLREVLQKLGHLDEPVVLSQEFINEKAVEVYADIADAEVHVVFRMRDLQNLLVPKQELPVIPKFVAEWIEEHKDKYGRNILEIGYDFYKSDLNNFDVDDWVQYNTEAFARAWLDGFTVEEEREPKYVIKISEHDYMVMDDEGFMYQTDINVHNYKPEFTEQEIKDYDERYWPFAVKVEEMEE